MQKPTALWTSMFWDITGDTGFVKHIIYYNNLRDAAARADRRTDGRAGGRTDGRAGGRTDGRAGERTGGVQICAPAGTRRDVWSTAPPGVNII